MNRAKVLVIEDDEGARGLVRELLTRAGYSVQEASTGRDGLRRLHEGEPELVVLDVTMPDLDGWQTLERIRDVSEVPVLMLTGRAAELERVRGLRGGADDYVTKPFGRQELLARIEALLRRAKPDEKPDTYDDGWLAVDFRQRLVRVEGDEVHLTPLEFRLLAAFVRNANQILSQEQLLELAWNDPYHVSPGQVKLYVGYLRRKLDRDARPAPIETVRGFGYRYRPPSAA